MVGKLKIDLDDWIAVTYEKQQADICYVSSYHIDELLLKSTKAQWIDDSFCLLNVLESKLGDVKKKDMAILLNFTLNRSKKKNHVVNCIDDSCFNKIDAPPEFYLVNKGYDDFFSYIRQESQKIEMENNSFQMAEVYYMEKWNYGFDRYLWIWPMSEDQ